MLPLGEVFVEIVGLDVFGFVAHGEKDVIVGHGDGCGLGEMITESIYTFLRFLLLAIYTFFRFYQAHILHLLEINRAAKVRKSFKLCKKKCCFGEIFCVCGEESFFLKQFP